MKTGDTFIIATPAWRFIAGLVVLFLILEIIDAEFLAFLAFVAMILIAYFYRNPERITPFYQEKSIVSVCDGKVLAIESVENLDGSSEPCHKVSIVSGYMDTAMLRAPFTSHLNLLALRRGARLSRESANFELLNEALRFKFVSKNENTLIVYHQLTQSFDDFNLQAQDKQELLQGARYGLMLKGITTLYIPASSRIAVNVGTHLRAGETLIGYFA